MSIGILTSGGDCPGLNAVIRAAVFTGIRLHEVDLAPTDHERALAIGCLRYCPICDGCGATHKAVGVLGGDAHGAREALFLREYTDRVSLLARSVCQLSDSQDRKSVV